MWLFWGWPAYWAGCLPAGAQTPDLGVNTSLHGKRLFPADDAWNTPVNNLPVDPNSDALINSIGRTRPLHPDFGANYNGGPFGIPYVVVSGNTPRVPGAFDYADESDPGPYPIPPDAPIEGGRTRMATGTFWWLTGTTGNFMSCTTRTPLAGGWKAGSGAIFDLNSDIAASAGWTSADAAGLPIFPGLVRYDEVMGQRAIRHALRFTVRRTRRAYVAPARHFASHSTDPSLPPMGMRVRLKASYDISAYPPSAQVILQALKTYGMILADNGSDWFVSGAPDARWNDDELNTLKHVTGNDLEVVQMGPLTTH